MLVTTNFARAALVLLALAAISVTVGSFLVAAAFVSTSAAIGVAVVVFGIAMFVAARWIGEES